LKYNDLHTAVTAFREKNDREAFTCIYGLLSPRLYYVCLRYLKVEADAQDVLQEAFVTAYRKIDTYSGNGSFEGWLRRITVNSCLAKLRLDKKQLVTTESGMENLAADEDDDYLEKEETEARLLHALGQLPDGYRTIINLAVLEDYSHREIGELLNITESTSRSQLTRAKAALKLKLEQL
jgi:RNA polymerase sigma factor (sigma-70 family)